MPASATSAVTVAGIAVQVVRKRIRNLNLTVHPPDGRVRVSAPHHTRDDEIVHMVAGRIDWIRRQQERIAATPTRQPADHGSLHKVWGEPVPLRVEVTGVRTRVARRDGHLVLRGPLAAGRADRERALDRWYRAELAGVLPGLVAGWSARLGIEPPTWGIRHMTTRWGSCNPATRRITVNLDLVREPPARLEYLVVHELVHLLEPGHGPRFIRLMDRHLPGWRLQRTALNLRRGDSGLPEATTP